MTQPRYGWIPGKEDYKPLRTLLDCARFKLNLRMTCRACGHSTVLDASGLWWLAERKGWDDTIPAIAARCYCEPCWTRRQNKVRGPIIVQTRETAAMLLPEPDARAWKRIVNRHRN